MAYFSQDPNIGIRQAGMGAFIPPAINSLSYKGNAGVNAQRKAARGNTKKPKTVIEGVTPGTFGPPSSLANPDSKPSKTFVPRDLMKRMPAPGILMANADKGPVPVKPTMSIRVSDVADGLVKRREVSDEDFVRAITEDPSLRPLNLNGIDPQDFLKGRAADRAKKLSSQFGIQPSMRST